MTNKSQWLKFQIPKQGKIKITKQLQAMCEQIICFGSYLRFGYCNLEFVISGLSGLGVIPYVKPWF